MKDIERILSNLKELLYSTEVELLILRSSDSSGHLMCTTGIIEETINLLEEMI